MSLGPVPRGTELPDHGADNGPAAPLGCAPTGPRYPSRDDTLALAVEATKLELEARRRGERAWEEHYKRRAMALFQLIGELHGG